MPRDDRDLSTDDVCGSPVDGWAIHGRHRRGEDPAKKHLRNTSVAGRDSCRRYGLTVKGRARYHRYGTTQKGLNRQRRYDASPKGLARHRRYDRSKKRKLQRQRQKGLP